MNIQSASDQTYSLPTKPYHVDVRNGGLDGSVSRQWMARPADQRFETLGALHRFKKAKFDASWDKVTQTRKGFEIVAPSDISSRDDMERLTLAIPGVRTPGSMADETIEVAPTNWGFKQLCGLTRSPAGWLSEMPSPQVADALNYRFRYLRNVEEIKLFGDQSTMQAATGPTYGRIPDHEIIAALQNIAGDGLGQDGFHWKTPGTLNWTNGTYDPENIGDVQQRTFYGSDRDMFVFLVDDRRPIQVGTTRDGRPDLMFRGFYIQNSEVGARSLSIKSFYLRGVCMNRNLWGCEGFEEITIRHTSLAPDRWLNQARPLLEAFANGNDRKLVESVEKAKAKKLVDDDQEMFAFLKARNFSRASSEKIKAVHEREEGAAMRTAWDFAQGITAFARDKINTDDRLDVELVAKKILDEVA